MKKDSDIFFDDLIFYIQCFKPSKINDTQYYYLFKRLIVCQFDNIGANQNQNFRQIPKFYFDQLSIQSK